MHYIPSSATPDRWWQLALGTFWLLIIDQDSKGLHRPKRQSMTPELYNLGIRTWNNFCRESGREWKSSWPMWPDCQAGDSTLSDCQDFVEGQISRWLYSFYMFLTSTEKSTQVIYWVPKVVEAGVNIFFLEGRQGWLEASRKWT